MTDINGARQKNREFADTLLRDIADAQARYARSVQDGDRLGDLTKQIERLKKHGGDDASERLRSLAKAVYRITGTSGGADGTRPSTADIMAERRQARGRSLGHHGGRHRDVDEG